MPLSNAGDYPLWINAAIFLAAAVVVWVAGSKLTIYLDGIAYHTGWGQAFVGMLLLGGITSLPEVANVATSSLTGNPRLGINNILGSASINVVLLAAADAFIGRKAVTSVVAQPSTLMMGTLCMLLLTATAAIIVAGDFAVFGVGIGAATIFLMSIAFFWIATSYGRQAPWIVRGARKKAKDREAPPGEALGPLVVKTVLAGAAIFVAGFTLSQVGDALAEQTGIGSGMVGFVLIGTSTSMPELSSIVTALRMRRYEMAFGQVLGTNFVNLSLLLLGDVCFSGGPVINELGKFETLSALLGAALTGIFVVGLLERKDSAVMRMGYDSLAVMIVFACGLVLLHAIG